MLDPLEPVLRRLLEEWPEIKAPRVTEILREDYGYAGSVDLVKKRLAHAAAGQGAAGAADGLSAGAGAAARLGRDADAAEDRRPRAARLRVDRDAAVLGRADGALQLRSDGRERFWRATSARFEWLGGVPRECVYDNLRSVVARRDGDQITWNQRFVALRGHYAFHATACTPATPREKGSVEGAVRHLKTGFWPARRIGGLADLDEQYADWRDRVCNRRRHATGGFWVDERLEVERDALRPLPPVAFDYAGGAATRVPLDGYLKLGGCFYRAPRAAGSSARRAAL